MRLAVLTTIFMAFSSLRVHARPVEQLVPQVQRLRTGPPADRYVIGRQRDHTMGNQVEHTLLDYQYAIDAGASYVKCNVMLTKDCQLICWHELDLTKATDAKTKFPDFVRAYAIDSTVTGTGILASDLTLHQVKDLRVVQLLPPQKHSDVRATVQAQLHPDAQIRLSGQVPSLQEYLDLVKGNADRVVGIYPETKHPTWHDSLQLACTDGTSFSTLLLQALQANNHSGPYNSPAWLAQPVFIQSLEVENLKALNRETNIPLMQLLDSPTTLIPGDPMNRTYGNLTTEVGMEEVASYAAGMGLDRGAYFLNISGGSAYSRQ